MDGLHQLPAPTGNRDHRQAGLRGKQCGTGAAWAIYQRRPQDGAFHGQAAEQVVGLQLAQQIGHTLCARFVAYTQGRHLHHAVHARQRGAFEQLARAPGMHTLEGLAGALHQNADAVNHGVDAPHAQEPSPFGRGLRLHEVHAQGAHAVRQAACGFHHVMVACTQGMHHSAANAAGGTTDQDSHVVLPCKVWGVRTRGPASAEGPQGARSRATGPASGTSWRMATSPHA